VKSAELQVAWATPKMTLFWGFWAFLAPFSKKAKKRHFLTFFSLFFDIFLFIKAYKK